MSEHTPGPWHVFDGGDVPFEICDKYCDTVATCEKITDAHLISAAPEMLEMLVKIKIWANHIGHECSGECGAKEIMSDIAEIIKKAGGKP